MKKGSMALKIAALVGSGYLLVTMIETGTLDIPTALTLLAFTIAIAASIFINYRNSVPKTDEEAEFDKASAIFEKSLDEDYSDFDEYEIFEDDEEDS